jgi:hypothetical protein
MRNVLLALAVLAALVIGTGYYLNWFSFAPQGGDNNTNVPSTVDKEKVKDTESGQSTATAMPTRI